MNIVTIDFDVIMGPSIGLYNNLIDDKTRFTDLSNEYPFLKGAEADLFIYEYLTRYCINVIGKKKVHFIKSHEQVVPLLNSIRDGNLINIDHHHDLGYDIEDWRKPIVGQANCGNWVKKLYDLNVINHYTWYSNPQSDELPDEALDIYKSVEKKDISELNIKELAEQTDMLIICQSFEWVPPLYQPLYWTWVGLYEEITGSSYALID